MDATELLAANDYLTLGTADASGRPWAVPVWFGWDGARFLWISKPGARHSTNLAERAQASVVVFDSTVIPGEGEALYADVHAAAVPDDDLDSALRAYSERCRARGMAGWTADRVTGDARHRMYAAVPTAAWLLDDRDERVHVELPGAVLR